ncbi:hypothetical protein XFF6990_140305 [Xanthomonas citri pv. fuscans]|uniref:Uncharacterized protein n=1 Tax=Xanthomonas campestris pv. phaseoli TaxID=317013 RepID=A0A7Z7IXQ4_XANCH|nr:hypothetical protein XFF6990_140305 [Xanthomonas citri pv. fuscans]SOO22252.1 hypothetical protein XFF6991_150013 [Xanthomonas phaseoli pv. phaseoli]
MCNFQQSKPINGLAWYPSFFNKATSQSSGAVSLPIAGPLAAWMPPSSPRGWVYGVSRER